MRKYIIIASLVLLAASCTKSQTTTIIYPTPTPTPTAALNTYNSAANYGFSFMYSNDFGFTTSTSTVVGISYIPVCDQNMVACAYLKSDDYKGTNFEGGAVSVNIDPSLNIQAKCYDFSVSTNEAQTQVPDVTINGVIFKSATGGGGAAGHFDKVQVYRNFNNGMCYEIAQGVTEANIANFPSGVVAQFDENAVWQKLQDVANTFKFTDTVSQNWQTFDDGSGFILVYPSDFVIDKQEGLIEFHSADAGFNVQYKNFYTKSSNGKQTNLKLGDMVVYKKFNASIDNIPAIEFSQNDAVVNATELWAQKPNDSRLFWIDMEYQKDSPSASESSNVLNKMLSSFKFTS